MATINLQYNTTVPATKVQPKRKDLPDTATVSASPGRYYYATINSKPRTFEKVGVAANGDEIYRDQNRR